MGDVSIENEQRADLSDVERAARELDPDRLGELVAHAAQLKAEQEAAK
jgi:hypothetical protein